MKKSLIAILVALLHQIVFAQVEEKKFSFDFENVTLEKAIETIEQKTDYTFYFDQDWFKNYQEPITLHLSNASIETVLNSLFQNTTLNFYVSEKKVILTKNTLIYDKLPENYFNPEKNKTQDNSTVVIQGIPIFQKELNTEDRKNENKVNFVGKENKASKGKTFELSGYVKEAKTGKPIPEVIIRTKDNEATAITDAQGHYTITLPAGLSIIETENFLYKKEIRKVMLYNNGKLDLSVSENVNQLKEVIVKGKKSETLKSANTGVTSIDVEGMKNIPMVLGERDIFKVATTIPGIKTAGEGAAGFNVRGGKTDQNLILLDNGVIYNPAHFFGFFSAINPFAIGTADIYKGSIPAEFGGRLSSVFDIKTKNGNLTKLSGEGGIGPVTSNLTMSTPIVKGKSSLLVGGRATYSDWILKTLDEKSLQNSKASFYDAVIKYNHRINEKNDIEGTAYYSNDKFSVSSDSLYTYDNRLFSLKWGHVFNTKHKAALLFFKQSI